MINQDFSTTILVDQTPAQAYNTILNVRAWWSGLFNESFEGSSEKTSDEFSFTAGEGAHYTKQKLVELVPNKKVVWVVTDANLSFVDNTDEWIGTSIQFDILQETGKTKIIFTHNGLVPGFQCYESCAPAWTQYIQQQLPAALAKSNQQHFTKSITVNKSPEVVFKAASNVSGWWSENIEGITDQLNGEFLYYFKDVHICKLRIIEFVPNKRIVWLVLDNYFNFTTDQSEWKGTKVYFDITEKGNQTELRITHKGLTPAYECYNICHDAWSGYINGSLRELIETGKGRPNSKEGGLNAELIEKWNLPRK